MDREEALAELESAVARRRLAGARVLAQVAESQDEAVLAAALSRERVRWVRNALKTGLTRLRGDTVDPVVWPPIDEAYDSDQVAAVTLQVTARLLHELEPLVGLLRLALQEEWKDFPASDAEKQVAAIEGFLEIMSDLHTASKAPQWREVDLRELAENLLAELDPDRLGEIASGGPSLVVSTDSRLLVLAMRNGLRNALEAVEVLNQDDRSIVITWGRSAGAFFAAILDNGPGLPSSVSRTMTPGVSTKHTHKGIGLSLAQQAASSLSGSLILSNREEGGVRFELRCPEGRESS